MITIYKYRLEITGRQYIEMPADSELLCVQTQRGDVWLWAQVDTSRDVVQRHVRVCVHVYGTGNPVPEPAGVYVGTVQTNGGDLVWHVYDQGEVS